MPARRDDPLIPAWSRDQLDSSCPPEIETPYFDKLHNAWVLSRHADILAAFRASSLCPSRSKEGFEPSDESLRLKTRGDNGGALTRSTAGVACPLYGPATTDIDLNGYFIHKGERVILSIIAANHDPDRCSCPNQLDVTRRDGGHLTWERGRTLV